MTNTQQEQQECQHIIDYLDGLYVPANQYESLVSETPPLFLPGNQAHRLLAFFWINRFYFPRPYRQWPPSNRLLAMFEGKMDAYKGGIYDSTPFLQEHQRLLPRSLSREHPYPWHLEDDARIVREDEEDRQALDTWVRKQIGRVKVDEENHLSRILSQLNRIPFRWPDFLGFVRDEWGQAETRMLQTDHSFIVAQHTVYQSLREQLDAMGRLC